MSSPFDMVCILIVFDLFWILIMIKIKDVHTTIASFYVQEAKYMIDVAHAKGLL